MKTSPILFALTSTLALPLLASAALNTEFNLGKRAAAGKIEVFNRTLDPSQAESPEVVYLTVASGDGLAWIDGIELSTGSIELEIKGKNAPGRSFVGIAFHGHDNATFDAVYLRPFNFQNAERRSHSLQYVSMPEHDWSNLRNNHPGKYEAALDPAPAPESWVKLKLVIEGKSVSAFVNDAAEPALTIDLLNDRLTGKIGLWVGNGSDGWFRNLRITKAD